MKIYDSVEQLIGNTPIIRLNNIKKYFGYKGNILAKIEYFNPAGSVKDRVAKYMISEAESSGSLKKGSTIIEPTSGNTGIGLAMLGASKGYKVILTMPETMSVERINLLKAYGAEVVLTSGKLGMQGAVEKANELNKQIENSIIAGQFYNPANPLAHYKTTAKEIYEATEGKLDYFVAGVGTGGTISGSAKYFKEKNSNVKIVAVEPEGSPLISKGYAGKHKIQGIGANFIPDNYKSDLVDEVLAIGDEESFEYAKLIARKEGVLVGISSGAALCAAVKIAKRVDKENINVVVLLPDTGDRYLSTDLFK